MKKKEINLGALESKFYEKSGEEYYKVNAIFGTQISFSFDNPVRRVQVEECSESSLIIHGKYMSLKMEFSELSPGLQKCRVKPYMLGFFPIGIYFGQISCSNKKYLLERFGNS
ncbi:hypothetical protein [Microbulbifer aggregans]|uniref:hypothetical protein n=1 Tax=Microbulbifer aggregans TaxID=1769779 RepID=UPI001CFDA811|nr:hypothetical protein [Microbulbifer aggregans]